MLPCLPTTFRPPDLVQQFTSIANVTYPDVYEDFLGVLDIFNFNSNPHAARRTTPRCVTDSTLSKRVADVDLKPTIASKKKPYFRALGSSRRSARKAHGKPLQRTPKLSYVDV